MEQLPPVSSGDPHAQAHNLERDYINQILNTQTVLHGEGRPDGVVPAPPGTIYIDDLNTNGARAWFKRHAQGWRAYENSPVYGWEVLDGDSGARKVESVVPASLEGGFIFRRINNQIIHHSRGPDIGATPIPAETNLCTIPIEFTAEESTRPIYAEVAISPKGQATFTKHVGALVNDAGWQHIWLLDPPATTNAYTIWLWPTLFTVQPWPFTLPGVPVLDTD